jgi:hypothetical protein
VKNQPEERAAAAAVQRSGSAETSIKADQKQNKQRAF